MFGGSISGAEAFGGTGFGFSGFFFAVLRRGVGVERMEEARGAGGDFVDRGEEGGFVGLRRLVKAGDLADVLEGGGADFFWGDGGIEVEEGFYVSAHWGEFLRTA